jgi:hypothetical protein
MGIMVRKRTKHKLYVTNRRFNYAELLTIGFLALNMPAYSRELEIHPYTSFSQTYSDNISNGAGKSSDGFISQVLLGTRISRNSAKSRFTLNYTAQGLAYEGVDRPSMINNFLQMTSRTELLRNTLFIDSTSTIGQANVNSNAILAVDRLSNANNNTAEYRTFRFSPYWQIHAGSYFQGTARVSYSTVSSDSGNTSGANNIASTIYQETINLNSGKKFGNFGWRLNFNNQDNMREAQMLNASGLNNVGFQSINGELNYSLSKKYRLFIRAGKFNNNINSSNNSGNNFYWTAGATWTPNPRFSLSVGYGAKNSIVSMKWQPSQRTTLQIAYRNSSVGRSNNTGFAGGGGIGNSALGLDNVGLGGSLGGSVGGLGAGNIGGLSGGFGGFGGLSGGIGGGFGGLGGGNSGSTWSGNLQHSTRATRWQAQYLVSTTTIQDILLNQNVFSSQINAQGNVIGDPVANGIDPSIPTRTNDVITSKRLQFSVSGLTQKSTLTLGAYQEDRTYDIQNISQNVMGANIAWIWRFSRKSSSTMNLLWQQTDSQNSSKSNLSTFSWRLTRFFSTHVNGSLEFRHIQQDFNTSNLLSNQNSRNENRVTASIFFRY